MLILIAMHIMALHEVGSNNPDGVEIKKNKDANGVPLDGIPFHPYYTVKDIFGASVFLIFFFGVVFFAPEMKVPGTQGLFLESTNFLPADPLKTPEHIAPVWYFTPFYAILRAIPNQLGGIFAMGLSVSLFLLLPWLDRSPVKSWRYRGVNYRIALTVFIISFFALGWLGLQAVSSLYILLARFFTVTYFLFFFLMPVYTAMDNDKTVPDRVRD